MREERWRKWQKRFVIINHGEIIDSENGKNGEIILPFSPWQN